MNGIIVIDKPSGYTSRDIVNVVCSKLNTKKVGHTGTLDPLASGVLVICVGKALKICELITGYTKEYVADVIIGYETDMLDITGKITKEKIVDITKNDVIKVLNSFIGNIKQEVPIYSSVKINGRKLYEYARSNTPVTLPIRDVNIYSLDLISDITKSDKYYEFTIKCIVSKGTYIRALIRDIGYKLGSYGTMKGLRRTKQGMFNIDIANSLEDINNNNNYKIYSIKDSLDIKKITLDSSTSFKAKNGASIYNYTENDIVLFLDNKGNEIAIYKKELVEGIYVMRPWKVF